MSDTDKIKLPARELLHAPHPTRGAEMGACGARDDDNNAGPTVSPSTTPFPDDVTCPDCRSYNARMKAHRTPEEKRTGPFELHYLELGGPRCGSDDVSAFPNSVVGVTDEKLVTCSACVPGAKSRLGARDPRSGGDRRSAGPRCFAIVVGDGPPKTACGEQLTYRTGPAVGMGKENGWTVSQEDVTCERCLTVLRGKPKDIQPPVPGGKRFNAGKTRFDLIPGPGALSEVANVSTFGMLKYDAHNWRKGLSWMDCFRAIISHSFKWVTGEERDPESGCLHMAHAAWNALALVEMSLCGKRYLEFDDRPANVAPIQGTEHIKEPARKLSEERSKP